MIVCENCAKPTKEYGYLTITDTAGDEETFQLCGHCVVDQYVRSNKVREAIVKRLMNEPTLFVYSTGSLDSNPNPRFKIYTEGSPNQC